MSVCTCTNNISSTSTLTYKGADYCLTECKQCGYIETKPIKKSDIDIYESGHYQVKSYFYLPLIINFLDYIYIYIILRLRGLNSLSNILDFGCGKGFFLYFLKLFKMKNIYGSETSISRARFASEINHINISSEYYSEGKIMDKTFDCITMIHVLEHIENPFEFLKPIIKDVLNINGSLFIEVPNIGSTASRLAGKTWAHFTPHFHVNHFTTQSFNNFCLMNNLKYELVSTFSFYNSAMGMTSAILFLFGYRGSIFEDLKKKKIGIIIPFIILLPLTILLELVYSIFFKKGSVIKCIIKK